MAKSKSWGTHAIQSTSKRLYCGTSGPWLIEEILQNKSYSGPRHSRRMAMEDNIALQCWRTTKIIFKACPRCRRWLSGTLPMLIFDISLSAHHIVPSTHMARAGGWGRISGSELDLYCLPFLYVCRLAGWIFARTRNVIYSYPIPSSVHGLAWHCAPGRPMNVQAEWIGTITKRESLTQANDFIPDCTRKVPKLD